VSGNAFTTPDGASEFGQRLHAARTQASLSVAKLANASSLSRRRVSALERGSDLPTEREISALATACRATVFELIPPGYSLRVLVHDPDAGPQEARGRTALDALLREYLAMVVELRSGNAVTAPSLRQEDLIELAKMLGDTPEAIEARLVELLDADPGDAPAIRSIILPSTA
jgi:transcriptional regulator with XRE-family HTH domain